MSAYDVAIIGAGYVGVPLAATFAEAGSRVLLVDVVSRRRRRAEPRREPHRGRRLASGSQPLVDAGPDRARRPTTTSCSDADAILIALPTPLSRQREPDLSIVEARRAQHRAACSSAGQLVVLESTT